jgi:hypothetical protein
MKKLSSRLPPAQDVEYHGAKYWHGIATRFLEMVLRQEAELRDLRSKLEDSAK